MQFEAPKKDRPKRPQGNPGGKVARPEENLPREDYIEFLRTLGPRDGESRISFECRLAYISRAREIWLEAWQKHEGVRQAVQEELGVARNNLHIHLRRCGLSPEILDKMARTKPKRAA